MYDEAGIVHFLSFTEGRNYSTYEYTGQLKNIALIPLCLSSANKFLSQFRLSTKDFYLLILFNPIGNEYHNPINSLFRKFFGEKFPYIIRRVKKISFFGFFFYLRRHGFLNHIRLGLEFFNLRKIRFIVVTSMSISIPYNLLSVKTYDYNYLFQFNSPKGAESLKCRAVILGDSPSHLDRNPTIFDLKKSDKLANKLSIFLRSMGCKFDILPHPRDAYFADKVSKITGFSIVKTNEANYYKEYLSFPSSVIFSLPKNSKVTLISFSEYAASAESIAKNYNYDLVLIR